MMIVWTISLCVYTHTPRNAGTRTARVDSNSRKMTYPSPKSTEKIIGAARTISTGMPNYNSQSMQRAVHRLTHLSNVPTRLLALVCRSMESILKLTEEKVVQAKPVNPAISIDHASSCVQVEHEPCQSCSSRTHGQPQFLTVFPLSG